MAESVTFNTTSGNLTSPLDEIYLEYSGANLASNQLKVTKGGTFTISTSSRFIQSIEITLLSKTNASQYVTANVGSTAYDDTDDTNIKYTWTGIAKSIVFTNANDDDARDFRIVSVKVTYTTTDPSLENDETVQTYPYTWDFTSSSSLWETSLEELELFTAQWSDDVTAGDYRPTTARTTDWGFNISILKGLRFNPVSVSNSPGLDYNWKHLWIAAGTTITIPSVKAGQKIQLTGTVNISGKSSNLTQVIENSEYTEYTVNANGDATLTFDNSWITTISVLKTDISAINAIGGTTTTNYFDVSPWPCYVVFRNSSNGVLNMSADEWESCSLISSNTSVVTIAKGTVDSGNRGSFTVTPVGAGTSTVTISFPGSDRYNPQDGTIVFTINKHEQTLSFAEAEKTISYGESAPTNALTRSVGDGAVTYSSSDTHVASVNPTTGALTINNSGTCTITATAAETTTYAQTSASYTLTVNATQSAPTITMYKNYHTSHATEVDNGASLTATFGDNVYVTGICEPEGPTVKYSSSDESVAKVDGSGAVTTKKGGDVVITVYTDSYQGYPDASVSYNLHINPAFFEFKFKPYDEGTINVDATITPQMTIPTLMLEDVISITALSSDPDVAAVPENLLSGSGYPYLDVAGGRIYRIKPVITGVAEGEATITVNFTSKNYTSSSATYTVHVVAAGTRNFNWADGSGNPTYTIYEGDYMMLPKITGNSNGNDSYSRGSHKKYVYKIEGSTTTMNTTDYRIHEGVPDIMVVEGSTEKTIGDNAIVFFAKGQGTTFPDTLMIYGKAAGMVTLRAKDPQNGLYCDATINIIPITALRSDSTNYVKNMSFPYTWDFTGDFSMTDIAANPHYWVEHSGYYAAGDGFFNVDWADRTNNGSSTNLYFKDFVAGNGDGTNTAGKYMPQFYGLQMMLQSSLYSPKIDRVQIKNYNDGNPGAPRFVISGGPTHLKLPKAPTQPDSYRIYMKIHTKGDTEVGLGLSTAPIKKYAVESGKYSPNCQLTANTDAIIFFDVDNTTSDNEGTIIYLSNTSIYWIATSTEAKSITQPGSMPYPAATYCYGKDLDFSLSQDANNSTFGATSGSDLTAWYAAEENFDNTTKTVEMTQITSPFSQDQGVFLKTATGKAGNYYMISKAENTTSPAAGTNVSSTNMLAPLMTSQAVSRFDRDGSGDITHTNFFLNYRYKNYDEHNIDGEAIGDYNYPYSWRFYRIHDTVTGSAKTAYLHVPGEQKEVSASARRANRASGDLDTSGSMVHIIFKGEANTTGISTVDNDSVTVDDDAWYTLQGVRVEVPTKGGIYIHNGRKVVVK